MCLKTRCIPQRPFPDSCAHGGAKKSCGGEVPCGLDSSRPPSPHAASPHSWQPRRQADGRWGSSAPEPAYRHMMLSILISLCTPSTQQRTRKLFGVMGRWCIVNAQVIWSIYSVFPQSISDNTTPGRGSIRTTATTKYISLIKISFGNWWCTWTY